MRDFGRETEELNNQYKRIIASMSGGFVKIVFKWGKGMSYMGIFKRVSDAFDGAGFFLKLLKKSDNHALDRHSATVMILPKKDSFQKVVDATISK